MSWNDIMRRVLPPIKIKKPDGTYKILEPHITSPYGETYNRPKGSSNPHGGVDFNYFGGQASPFNLSHQGLRSPVTGIVTNAGEGSAGRIAIRGANGFTHEILHTHAQHVSIGDPVVAGQLIGTMGNTGAKQQHVHYQLKDRDGNVIDPSTYWDKQGPIDPNPAPPAYLVGDDLPSAAAESLPSAPSDPNGSDQQSPLNSQLGNAASSQAQPRQRDPGFPELSSPTLPRGWSRMSPEELIQTLPEPEPLSGDALHEWFVRWIKSFDR